jgi:hypothetical protein
VLVLSVSVPAEPASALPYGLGGVVVLAIAIWLVKQFLGEAVNELSRRSFGRLIGRRARRRPFGRRALRTYRETVLSSYATHTLGFSDHDSPISIEQVYVTLQYETADHRADVHDRIRTEPRTVVVGDPGAGKSMLLKKSMLMWAAERPGASAAIPVLVGLHRANDLGATPEELVVTQFVLDQLAENGPALRAVVARELREGRIQVLFDGLDEVASERRAAVERELVDFARQYPKCQIVVTCRKAVYAGQLGERFPHVVTIAEFDDASIRRLMHNWQDLSKDAAEELWASLRDNPPLLRLARNPLLLTMILYLYVNVSIETGQALPSSRAMFYDLAIDHLLRRDVRLHRGGPPLTKFSAAQKLAVLQHTALALQETPAGFEDQMTVPLGRLRSLVGQALPDLNIGPEQAGALLQEIIERSQLLVAVDRDQTRFQFRHLTLREYLAARELVKDPDRLLSGYGEDPVGWREVVTLWCAQTSQDATGVIEAVFAGGRRHSLLALECLVEVNRVRDAFAREVVEHFRGRLGSADGDGYAVEAAFGALAADDRPRGRQVRATLVDMVRRSPWRSDRSWSEEWAARSAALRALSACGRLDIADVLAELAADDPAARSALRGTGELAIPALAGRSAAGDFWAVDDLAAVGTPAAAERLVDLLWDSGAVAVRAAWRLAELFLRPGVEDALRRAELRVEPAADRCRWVWRPFGDPDGQLGVIAGRVVYLLDVGDPPPDPGELDPRLALPVAAWRAVDRAPGHWGASMSIPHRLTLAEANDLRPLIERVADRLDDRTLGFGIATTQLRKVLAAVSAAPAPGPDTAELERAVLDLTKIGPRHRVIIDRLPWRIRAVFLSRCVADPAFAPREQDWAAVRTPPPRRPVGLWWVVGSLWAVVVLLLMAALVRYDLAAMAWTSPLGPEWTHWSWTTVLVTALVVLFSALERDWDDRYMGLFLFILVVCFARALGVLWLELDQVSNGLVATAVPAALTAALWLLTALAVRREKAVANPLRACLDADDQSSARTLSILGTVK